MEKNGGHLGVDKAALIGLAGVIVAMMSTELNAQLSDIALVASPVSVRDLSDFGVYNQ